MVDPKEIGGGDPSRISDEQWQRDVVFLVFSAVLLSWDLSLQRTEGQSATTIFGDEDIKQIKKRRDEISARWGSDPNQEKLF